MSTHDPLVIAGREFGSRLLTGTGKFDTFETMRDALTASGSEIVTVAVRRIDFDARDEDITTFIPEHMLLLPNTSGDPSYFFGMKVNATAPTMQAKAAT